MIFTKSPSVLLPPFSCSNYGIDPVRLEAAAEEVWKALMRREDYEQAEWYAKSIGI